MRATLGLDVSAPRTRIRDVLAVLALGVPGLAVMAATFLGLVALVVALT